jgi:hypothetical protein
VGDETQAPMRRFLTPIHPGSGHASVGRPAHRYPHGVAYIPYRIGIARVPDPPKPALPVVLPATFSLQFPTYSSAFIGRCLARNFPLSWHITSGNEENYWAINDDGILTVFNIGMFGGVHYEISVTASNDVGDSEPESIFISTSNSNT